MLTIEDLYAEADRFLWENYRDILVVPIEIEEDFIFEEGAFECTRKSPRRILIAEFVMIFADDDVVLDVLRHELVHYALHRRKEPFADGHPHFESELERHGIASSGSTMIGIYHLYECTACHKEIPHYQKADVNNKKIVTHCCEAPFEDKKQVMVYSGNGRIY